MTQKQVIKIVKEMPARVDVDELIYRLYLKKKLEAAEEDIRKGRTIPHAKMVREVQRWFVSYGRKKRLKI